MYLGVFMMARTIYEQLGGSKAIESLVARFYELMDVLPEAYGVRQMHPDSLEGSADSLVKFLSGWFGGPQRYVEERGHPRLRMRHAPYSIGVKERDEWMLCMRQALADEVADDALRQLLQQSFDSMATHIINTADSACGCRAA